MAKMRKEYEPQATEAIKSRLVLEAIINAEKIEASEEEIKAKISAKSKRIWEDADYKKIRRERLKQILVSLALKFAT